MERATPRAREGSAQRGRQLPWKLLGFAATGLALGLAVIQRVDDPLQQRCLLIAIVYLTLALSEIVEPFVPTLFLLVAIPLAVGPLSPKFGLSPVLGWVADPVLALFAGGFALGLAAHRHGLDATFASLLMRAAGSSRRLLVAEVMLATACMSMWISNVAAASLTLVTLGPLLRATTDVAFRRALLLSVAMAANLGGMATPIGSGPNGIAIAATRASVDITFLDWMSFGVPLVLGMLVLGFALIVGCYAIAGEYEATASEAPPLQLGGFALLGLFAAAVAAWLSEPLHGVSAPTIALALTLALFASGLLRRRDLGELDWSTLGLIAGGLALGRLLESSGLLTALAGSLELASYPRWIWLGAFVWTSAILAALMSNTATAALLVPIALLLDPAPATAIIIAIATSFGMPFPISTPPNAMVYGHGDVRIGDLLLIGVPLMLLGCVIVTLSGAWFLGLLGLG